MGVSDQRGFQPTRKRVTIVAITEDEHYAEKLADALHQTCRGFEHTVVVDDGPMGEEDEGAVHV